jgi:hypothetical protein
MAWAEFFYSTNIPFAVARLASFKKAVKMTSKMRTSYLPPSYHDVGEKVIPKINPGKLFKWRFFEREGHLVYRFAI